jgi:para-nitrobenzyl esterase
MQIVKTDKGYVSGTLIGEPDKEVSIFRGIPFASPPVGDLRWKPPQPAEPWEGIRECTQFSAISPQTNMPGMPSPLPLSEDCLYLNVLTPARQPDEKLPVMVWMHGGGYSMGCGNDEIWNNYRLPRYGVVLVTLNHRLGPIGLLAHPALSKESPDGVSGNYLFLDLIASLQWIQRNISAFGGDPGNVTIFGESGGGAKVSIMMCSALAIGLFHRAICESGTALAVLLGKSLAEIENDGKTLFKKLGIDSAIDPLEQARRVPLDKIMEVSQSMEVPHTPPNLPVPVWDAAVDGWLLPDTPLSIFRAGKINPVPLISCANTGELMTMFPMLVPGYVEMFNGLRKAGADSYACIFDQVPAKWRQEGMTHAPHGLELMYVFGDYDNITGWWEMTYDMMSMMGTPLKSRAPGLTEKDKNVSESMMRYWTQFARTGSPNGSGLLDWPAWDASGDKYVEIDYPPRVKSGYSLLGQ